MLPFKVLYTTALILITAAGSLTATEKNGHALLNSKFVPWELTVLSEVHYHVTDICVTHAC